MIKVLLVIGARPQFIKSAPVVKEIKTNHPRIDLEIMHSGQHYDKEMSAIFFKELHIPKPSLNLHSGSGSHARQTATIMKRLEPPILRAEPNLVLVPGDTNTTLAAALTAAKLNIPVAHIEAGLRSGDMTMPEEINRRLTDHCGSILFAPTQTAVSNLKKEDLGSVTFLTGDTMVDALQTATPFVRKRENAMLDLFGLVPRQYALVTLHRPFNVDDMHRLKRIQHALRAVARKLRILFLAHPRTKIRLGLLGELGRTIEGLTIAGAQGYIETLALLKNASCLLTDSGGMQKEAFLLRVPCLTIRQNTEWPETLVGRANQIVKRPERIPEKVFEICSGNAFQVSIRSMKNPFGDGKASARIAKIMCNSGERLTESCRRRS